jgi:multidrug efflux pump subunit AcrA (membrane-fusion protein)
MATEAVINGGKGNSTAISSEFSPNLQKSSVFDQANHSFKNYSSSTATLEKNISHPSTIAIATPSNPYLVQVKPEALTLAKVSDFMPSISLWTRLGGMFLAGSVFIAIGLSAVTPYKTTVKTEAKIRPSGDRRIVEAKTEGTVIDILVKPNQLVKKRDVIAIVDRSSLETKKSQLESNLQQADLQLKQIKAQIQSQNHRLQAESDRISSAVMSALAELKRNQREYRDQQITSTAEVKEAEANLKLAQEELKQAETDLITTNAEFSSAQAAFDAAKSKFTRYQSIAVSGALSQNQLEETRLDVEQQRQQVVAKQANINRQKQEISRRQQAISAVEAKLQNVLAGVSPIDAEVAIAQENISQEQARGKATLASVKQEIEASIQQQIEIEQQQRRDRTELKQIERDLTQTVIRATTDGIILQLNLRNSGQNVTLGEEIAQITPYNSSLVVKALVSTQEIDKVILGQQAQVKISACPYPDFGTLKGKVTQISSDTIGDPNSDSSQAIGSFYEVNITPETTSLGNGTHPCLLQPGMEGKSDIISREETLLKYFLRKARLIVDL